MTTEPLKVSIDTAKMQTPRFLEQILQLAGLLVRAIPEALWWKRFRSDALEWSTSGQSTRFMKCQGSNFVLDKETGRIWPMALFRHIQTEDFEE